METQRQELFAQWEAKLNQAQEATEAANAAHQADKEAVQRAASQAVAAAAGDPFGFYSPNKRTRPACPL